jgi:hypothetical protein
MSKTVKGVLIGAIALLLLLVCCGVGSSVLGNSDGGAPKVNLPRPVTPTATAVAPATAKGLKDGQWLIGTDAPAGRYQSSGPDRGLFCYWQLTTDPNAQPGDKAFITNDAPPGRSYVNLRKGEYFKTSNCGPWTLIA